MKKRLLTVTLAAALIMAGCGKIDDEPAANTMSASGAQAAAGSQTGEGSIDKALGVCHKITAVSDGEEMDVSAGDTEEAVRLILEAVSRSDPENNSLEKELFPNGRQAGESFSDGFEISLVFESAVDISVGEKTFFGNKVIVRRSGSVYYFDIVSQPDDNSEPVFVVSALGFDEGYIPRITDALSAKEDPGKDKESEPIDYDRYYEDITDKIAGAELYYGGMRDISGREREVGKQILTALDVSGDLENALETDVYCMDQEKQKAEGFAAYLRFTETVDILVGKDTIDGNLITVIKDEFSDSYYCEIDIVDANGSLVSTRPAMPMQSAWIETILDQAGVRNEQGNDEPGEGGGILLTPENISDQMFGFELFNDGHLDCWESRYDCAKVMLEAIAKADPNNTVNFVPTLEELNEKEHTGFMTWLKFEDPMDFNVGDTVISGNMLEIVDHNGSYYFFIGDFEEVNGMIELDSSCIPEILAAAGSN